MIIQDTEYKEIEDFLETMHLKIGDVRKILTDNLGWEKEFILQRAKEERIFHMEEYLRDFDIIHPKKAGSFANMKVSILDTKTGIIYKSFNQLQIKMKIPYSRVKKFLETGRFKKIDKTKILEGKDANN